MLLSRKFVPIVMTTSTMAMSLIIFQVVCEAQGPQTGQEVDRLQAEGSSSIAAVNQQQDDNEVRPDSRSRFRQRQDEDDEEGEKVEISLAKHNLTSAAQPQKLLAGPPNSTSARHTAAGDGSMPLVVNANFNYISASNENSTSNINNSKTTNQPASLMVPEQQDADVVPAYMQHMTTILVILHLSVFITGLVGNSLVCLSVYRNKSLQTVTNYYIVNLAVADFLVILICLPPTVYWDLTLTWNFGLVLCKLVLYLQSISVSVSVLTLTCISIDRWYAICRPLEFCSTKYRAKITIALIWLLSMLIASPDVVFLTTRPLYEEADHIYMDCTYSWPEDNTKMYQLCIVTLLFLGPFVLMTISYSHIVNVLWRNETMAESLLHSIQLEEEKQFQLKRNQLDESVAINSTKVVELASTITTNDDDDDDNDDKQMVVINQSPCSGEKEIRVLCNTTASPKQRQSIPSNCNQISLAATGRVPQILKTKTSRRQEKKNADREVRGEKFIVSSSNRTITFASNDAPSWSTKSVSGHDAEGEDRVTSLTSCGRPSCGDNTTARISIAQNNVTLDHLDLGQVSGDNDGFISLLDTSNRVCEQSGASHQRQSARSSWPDNSFVWPDGRLPTASAHDRPELSSGARQATSAGAAARCGRLFQALPHQVTIVEEEQDATSRPNRHHHNYSAHPGQRPEDKHTKANTSGERRAATRMACQTTNCHSGDKQACQGARRSLSDGSPLNGRSGPMCVLGSADETKPEEEISVVLPEIGWEPVRGSCNPSNGSRIEREIETTQQQAGQAQVAQVDVVATGKDVGRRQIVQVINGVTIVSRKANESCDRRRLDWQSWWRPSLLSPFPSIEGKRRKQQLQRKDLNYKLGAGDKALSKRYRKNMANYAAKRANYGQVRKPSEGLDGSSLTTTRLSDGRTGGMQPKTTTTCSMNHRDDLSKTGSESHCQEACARPDPMAPGSLGVNRSLAQSVHQSGSGRRVAGKQQHQTQGYQAAGSGAAAAGSLMASTNTNFPPTATTNSNEDPQQQQLARPTSRPNGNPSQLSNHHHASSSSQTSTRFCKLIESRKKAAKMLIVIVIMFGLCYLPIHFLNILRYTIGLPQNDITTIASLVSHWLCYFNSAVNPLIYNLMSGKFRHEFANLFFCKCFARR